MTVRNHNPKRGPKGHLTGLLPAPRPVIACECGDHAFAALTRWGVTLVSPEDAELLGSRAWHLEDNENGCAYAIGKANRARISLHGLIAGTPPGLDTDHENTNGLDNRRFNLRDLTRAENNRNRRKVTSKSGFRGVAFHPHSGLWRGYVNVDKRQFSAGYHKTADQAARARDALCIERGLTTARLNFTHEANRV